jgi:hypothetical protein
MAKIGLAAGQPFDMAKFSLAEREALSNVGKVAQAKIFAQQETSGFRRNGWTIPAAAGVYGTNYLARALIAAFGWPANLPQDAVYPYALEDGVGQKLSGTH